MLYKRYSSPLTLLQQMIDINRLPAFIDEFLKIYNEELEEKTSWEFFLHKVYGQTYAEFKKEAMRQEPVTIVADMKTVETTVKQSTEILNSFRLK